MSKLGKIPEKNSSHLKADGILSSGEKGVIRSETLKATGTSLGNLKDHFEISDTTRGQLTKFVAADISPRVKKQYIQKINAFSGISSSEFTLESFYATLSIQKRFINFTKDNPLEVYKFFGTSFPQVEIDGIPGPNTLKALSYLQKIEQTKRKYLETEVGIPESAKNIGEIFMSALNQGIKKYAQKLNSNEGVELSSKAIYKDIKSLLESMTQQLTQSKNIFAGDIGNFIKNFLSDEQKAVNFIQYFINQFLGKKNPPELQMSVVYDIYASSITFLSDVTLHSSPEQMQKKMSEIRSFPLIQNFLSQNPDFATLFEIFPQLSKLLDEKDAEFLRDFLGDIRPLILDISLGKGTAEELEKKATTVFQKLLYFFEDILKRFQNEKPEKQTELKQIITKILSLGAFSEMKNTPVYELLDFSLKNDKVDALGVSLKFLGLAQEGLRAKQRFQQELPSMLEILEKLFDEKQRNEALDALAQKVAIGMSAYEFIQEAEKNFSQLPKEEQKRMSEVLKKLIPEQTKTDSWLTTIQNNAIKKFLDYYSTIENESLKSAFTFLLNTGGTLFSTTIVDKINTVFTANSNFLKISFPKDAYVSKQLVETFKSKVAQLIKQKLASGAKLSKKELVREIKATILDVSTATQNADLSKIAILLQNNPFIIETITTAVLDDLSKRDDVGVYLVSQAQETNPKNVFLSRLDMLADGLFALLSDKKHKTDMKKLGEETMIQYGFAKLLGIKIFGKGLVESMVMLIGGMNKSEFKLFLFKNAETIQEILGGNMRNQTKLQKALELVFKAVEKSPQAKLSPFQKEMVEFMRTAEISQSIPSEENPRVIAETIDLGDDVFTLYGRKFSEKKAFSMTLQESQKVLFFADKIFDMIYALILRYGPRGLEMVNSGQIYENKFDTGAKKGFFDALKLSFKDNSHEVTKGKFFSLLGELIGSLFTKGKLEISEKTQQDLIVRYFQNLSNKQDFRQVMLGVFYK